MATVAGTSTSYDDIAFQASEIGAPKVLQATQGTLAGQVRLRWQAPDEVNETHKYVVVALHTIGGVKYRSLPSNTAIGTVNNAPLVRYEVSRDGGESWLDAGTELEYGDTHPNPSILEGTSLASFDATRGLTVLSLAGAPTVARNPSSSYRVRAVTERGVGPASDAVTGFAAIGDVIAYQWQRMNSSGVFEDLPGVTGARWFDANTPLDANPTYRVRMSTDGAIGQSIPASALTESIRAISSGRLHNCMLNSQGIVSCFGGDWRGTTTVPEGVYRSIAAGSDHSCAIAVDGKVTCWGENGSGQSAAQQGQFEAVSAGFAHSCGILSDHTLTCWGANDRKQREAPSGEFSSLDAGLWHNCAIRLSGEMACWGSNSDGQAPATIDGQFKAVSAGESHSCAIDADDNVRCWGSNRYGEAPSKVIAGPFRSISAGYYQTCGVLMSGKVLCFGTNDYGEAPTEPPSDVFRRHPPSDAFDSVSCGLSRTCGVRRDGRTLCWGSNSYGAAPPVPPQGTFTAGTAGSRHACAIKPDDRVACWGRAFQPLSALPDSETFSTIAAGEAFTCGIRSSGLPVCWGGQNIHGEESAPQEVFASIGAGMAHACGVRPDGTARCWGSKNVTDGVNEEWKVPQMFFRSITGGYAHSCAIAETRSIDCWSFDGVPYTPTPVSTGRYSMMSSCRQQNCAVSENNQLVCFGDGAVVEQAPTGLFQSVSVGGEHACAIRYPDKRVTCWGKNNSGQAPASPTIDAFDSIFSGEFFTCGIRVDGKMLCWGYNGDGAAPQP